MIGLRNGALALYRKPLTFAVSDPATNTVYKWKPAVGVTALKSRETGSTASSSASRFRTWPRRSNGAPRSIDKGTCYWINPLIAAARAADESDRAS